MKIYTLIENEKQRNTGFLAEYGLSLYFEYGGNRILFNTGASDNFVYNATLLGIDLHKIDICIISDAYFTQIGGLKAFFHINNKAKVYLKKAVRGDYYIRQGNKKEQSGGIDDAFFEKYSHRLIFFNNHIEVTEGMTLASVKRFRRLPYYTSLMLEKRGSDFIGDELEHELYVAIKQSDGVIVLTGCAHHGLINILMSAQEDFGTVKGVVGGVHLNGVGKHNTMKEPEFEIATIAKYLENNNIKKVYMGHFADKKQLDKLMLMSRAKRMYAGDIIDI